MVAKLACVLSLLAISAGSCLADSALPSDVAVTLSANKTTGLKTGDPVTFTMTVENRGPETLSYFSINGPEIFTEFYDPGTNWNDCGLLTDTGDSVFGPFWILVWFPAGLGLENPVSAGEVRSCHFTLMVAPGLPSRYPFAVELGTYFTDINSANNSASIVLQRASTPIPAASVLTLSVVFLVVLVIACFELGRRT